MGTHPAVVVVLTVVDLVGMTRFERRLGRHGHVSPRAPRCGPKWRGDQRELCEKAADLVGRNIGRTFSKRNGHSVNNVPPRRAA